MEKLEDFINKHRVSEEKSIDLPGYLLELMNKYKIEKDSYIYKKANITKQAWSAIMSRKCTPSINTCIKIIFAMKLNNHECKYLLKKAGYTLASSSNYAIIIRYCIENKIYDICDLNDLLKEYNCPQID